MAYKALSPYYEPKRTKKTDAQSEEERIVKDNWNAYLMGRDSGHLKYVEEAKRFDEYYRGEQWSAADTDKLDSEGRPHQTINLVMSTVNAVLGEHINTRQDISFAPRGGQATQEVAKALAFVTRQVQDSNHSKWNEGQMLADGLIEDRGYIDLRIDFSDNIFGEVRERVLNPRDVILDAGACEYDPNTWSSVIVTRWMTPDEIAAMYGSALADRLRSAGVATTFGYDSVEWSISTFGDPVIHGLYQPVVSSDDGENQVRRIRVIERQYKKLCRRKYFVDLYQGDLRPVPEDWSEERVVTFARKYDLGVTEKVERRIRWTTTADKVLLYDDWSLYNRFTVVPFFPFFRRGRPVGLVRNLISPQDVLNKVTSQELHVVNTTANSGWIFEAGSLVNMDAADLKKYGAQTGLVLEVLKGSTPPEKILPNQVPSGLAEIGSKTSIFFRMISGIPEGMLGHASREVSGDALSEQRRGGLLQLEVVFDNLARTRQYRGDLMLELIQQFYTEQRIVHLSSLSDTGDSVTEEMVVNQSNAAGEIVNNLSLGEYNVIVQSVPHHDSMNDTIFSQLVELRNSGVMVPDYLLLENSRLPNRKEVADVVKRLQGLAEPTEHDIQLQAMQEQLQLASMEASVREIQAKAALAEANAMLLQAKAANEQLQPQLESEKLGVSLRADLEKLAGQLQTKQAELAARVKISDDKNASNRFIAQVQSMTKRVEAANRRDETLIKVAAQGSRSPKERKKPSAGR